MSDPIPMTPIARRVPAPENKARPIGSHHRLICEIGMEAVLRRHDALKEIRSQAGITLSDCLIRAVGLTLARHPALNPHPVHDAGCRPATAHISVQAADESSFVWVISNANSKSLFEIATERACAKAGQPRDSGFLGAPFIVCNLNGLSAETLDASVDLSHRIALAVGSIRHDFLSDGDGTPLPAKILNAVLSVDHRAADEATGVAFLADLKATLEDSDDLFEAGPLDRVSGSA